MSFCLPNPEFKNRLRKEHVKKINTYFFYLIKQVEKLKLAYAIFYSIKIKIRIIS